MNPPDSTPGHERIFDGIPASPGIVVAGARVIAADHAGELDDRMLDEEEVELEIERFRNAVAGADRVLEQIEMMAREEVEDRAGIFEALRMMLHDPVLIDAIEEHMRCCRSTAHAAICAEMIRLADLFDASTDETIRSRAEDMRSLQSHLIASLSNTPLPSGMYHDAVLILSSLSPSDTVIHARNRVSAFVLEAGGINSHSAILARALAIPMVAGVKGICHEIHHDATVIVDGYTGRVIVDPDEGTRATYELRKALLEEQRARYDEIRDLPAETIDGTKIVLASNLDMIEEIEGTLENGADEIGLMRTEYLVMGRDPDVSMEEHLHFYRLIAERAYPLMVTLRALDVGSEKLSGEIWGRGSSLLGMRGTRLLLARREILERQIEAVLRASTMKNVRFMLPMITDVGELRKVKAIVGEVCERLKAQGVVFDERMPVGAMIETPAAALSADFLARESTFLSIGSNDLAQYTLAVDREDDALSTYYDELHPAVLRLIRVTLLAGRRANVPVTICGEIAANPLATALLIGLGARRFSVPPSQLGPLKMRVREVTVDDAVETARAVVRMTTAEDVRTFLTRTL